MWTMLKSLGHFLVSTKYRPLVLITLTILISGTVFFHFIEGWQWLDSFYFCVITLATVGYGDFTPKTNVGKIAVIFYVISGIGIFLSFLQAYFEFIKEDSKRK